ncbi:DUF1203 domain-containing protein [Porticoccaceae bacterium]|nr:DUF1203 domain-containing protein [Porticoccaceae bacterium]
MPKLKFIPLPTNKVRRIQRGSVDANGQIPERQSKGGGPCRHCLQPIGQNEEMPIVGYCPFPEPQPYAETGPTFLHAKQCSAYQNIYEIPAMFSLDSDSLMIISGYGDNNRIQYSAAAVVPIGELEDRCETLLNEDDVAYLHVRYGLTNCYQFRVERG